VASQYQVALLDRKRPLPQLLDPLDPRARLPDKLVPVCHRLMLTRAVGPAGPAAEGLTSRPAG
jgi:hypothetical protein